MTTKTLLCLLLLCVATQTVYSTEPTTRALQNIRNFRPIQLDNACVPNALIFHGWFRTQHPENWVTTLTIFMPEVQENHELVCFELENTLYLWDMRYGVLPLGKHEKSIPELTAAATIAYDNIMRPDARFAYQNVELELERLYKSLNRTHSTLWVAYRANDYLVFFTENGRVINVFSPHLGTQRGKVSAATSPQKALEYVLTQIAGGTGKYKILGGRFAQNQTPESRLNLPQASAK